MSHTMPLRCPRLHDSLPRQGHTLRGAPFNARLPQAQTAPARNVQAFLLIVHLLTEPSCIFQSTLAVLILEALPHTTSSYRTEYLSSPVNQRCVTALPTARCVPRTQMLMLVLMLLLLDAAFRFHLAAARCMLHAQTASTSLSPVGLWCLIHACHPLPPGLSTRTPQPLLRGHPVRLPTGQGAGTVLRAAPCAAARRLALLYSHVASALAHPLRPDLCRGAVHGARQRHLQHPRWWSDGLRLSVQCCRRGALALRYDGTNRYDVTPSGWLLVPPQFFHSPSRVQHQHGLDCHLQLLLSVRVCCSLAAVAPTRAGPAAVATAAVALAATARRGVQRHLQHPRDFDSFELADFDLFWVMRCERSRLSHSQVARSPPLTDQSEPLPACRTGTIS